MAELDGGSLGARYELRGRLGAGGMGEVYRAWDRLEGREIALKRLLPTPRQSSAVSVGPAEPAVAASEATQEMSAIDSRQAPSNDPLRPVLSQGPPLASIDPAPSLLLSAPPPSGNRGSSGQPDAELRLLLTQEFHTLASLRHRHIISVLDYGFDAERVPYFTMELLSDAQPISQISPESPLAERVSLVLQVLQALTYLHRRGVLHRDLKPANLLVVRGAAGPVVKLLDFGLAVLRRDLLRGHAELAGTPGYIAPELLFGAPPSERSDLFAVGIIAFQLLSGKSAILRDAVGVPILGRCADELDWDSLALSEGLRQFLQHLLARHPSDRPTSADEAAQALRAAVALPPSGEDASTQESFLSAATLVGRETELRTLKTALKAARGGQGAGLLLAGESGVGKSRLCDELKAQAQVRGVTVLRGQADRHTGGLDLFAPALRTLCLAEPLTDLEASILKPLLPDLPQLLRRPLPDAPELSTQAARMRLLLAMEQVLLGSQTPRLLLLEDLHWAQPDSLELLRRLTHNIAAHPVLIVATYRDDERAGLPGELPDAQVLKLPRLGRDAVGELIDSMVGPMTGRTGLLDLLLAESAGNTFFIVEAMRTLVETQGGLAQLAHCTLPPSIWVGGIQQALQRRLSRVPGRLRTLLNLAAVAGRVLDEAVLAAAQPGSSVPEFLQLCSDACVLEVSEGRYRFAHDKLRERVLAELSPAEMSTLHAQLAQAIERVHAGSPTYAALLSHHYLGAGRLREAGAYAAGAGEAAVLRGALSEAQVLLRRAIDLLPQRPSTYLQRVRLYRFLLHTHLGLGQLMDRGDEIVEALQAIAQPMPTQSGALGAAITGAVLRQAWNRLRPWPARPPRRAEDAAVQTELCYLFQIVSEYLLWKNKPLPGIYYAYAAANASERQNDPFVRSLGYASLSYIFCITPLKAIAQMYATLAEHQYDIAPSKQLIIYPQRGTAFMYSFSGQLTQAIRIADSGIALAQAAGDPIGRLHLLFILWRAQRVQGDIVAAAATGNSLYELALATDHAQYRTMGLAALGSARLLFGRLAEAAVSLQQALELGERSGYAETALHGLGLLALCAWRRGDRAEAERLAERSLQAIDIPMFAHDASYEGYPACVETFVFLHASESDPIRKQKLQISLTRALSVLKRFSAIFPNGHAAYHRLQGQVRWLAGDHATAGAEFAASEAAAERYEMRYDAALAQAWRARLLPADERRTILAHAAERLRHLGASWDAEQVEGWQ
ncbi:MAG TPA: AAA family ATPase [Pseudomonadota bacterium]|nr:AAA family ATPase [Pseudomonadota bacterium]